jgi:hypothetical protein
MLTINGGVRRNPGPHGVVLEYEGETLRICLGLPEIPFFGLFFINPDRTFRIF